MGLACDVGAYERGIEILPLRFTVTGDDVGLVMGNSLCYEGPGPEYEVVNSLFENMNVQVIGVDQQIGWLVLDSPLFPGVACWVEEDNIAHSLEVDLLDIFFAPVLPTPPPRPLRDDDGMGLPGDSGGPLVQQQEDPADTPNACIEPPNGCPDPLYWSQVLCSCTTLD